MKSSNSFRFKQFAIVQQQAAMKVGIDGVLLGAWADVRPGSRFLDVGTGTGLIALMFAQRAGNGFVDAVEIDPVAAAEAQYNVEQSGWGGRMRVYATAMQQFRPDVLYDHVVSNPPFFNGTYKTANLQRNQARHADSLPLQQLLEYAAGWLAPSGKISLIIHHGQYLQINEIADKLGLCITKRAFVYPDQTKKFHRLMVELSVDPAICSEEKIYLRDAQTNEYTDQYKQLTRDFYLAF